MAQRGGSGRLSSSGARLRDVLTLGLLFGTRIVRGDGLRPRAVYAALMSIGVRGVSGGLPERDTERIAEIVAGRAGRPRSLLLDDIDRVKGAADPAESDEEDEMLRRMALFKPDNEGCGGSW